MSASFRWSVAWIAAVSPLLADEVLPGDGFADLRLGYVVTRKQADITTGGATTSEDWQQARRVFGGVVVSPGIAPAGGWLFGVRVVASFNRGEPGGQPTTYDTATAQFSAGYGYAFCRSFQIEAMPYVGLGVAGLTQTFAGSGEFKDSAFAIQYGIDLNAVATIAHGVQLGVGVGYEIASSDHQFDNVPGPGTVKTTIKQKGFTGALFIGGRF